MNINYFSPKHRPIKLVYVCFFAFYLFSNLSNAQKIYLRVSPNDCINCYIGFFQSSLNYPDKKLFKYIFPKKFKGSRFEQFNSMYFHNVVAKDQVIFSDSLFAKTKKPLSGLSGVVLMYKGKVLLSATAEEVSKGKNNLFNYLDKCKKLHSILDMAKAGVSSNTTWNLNFNKNLLIMNDQFYRKIYFFNGSKSSAIDLKTDAFSKLIKKFEPEKSYLLYEKYKPMLKKMNKVYPEYPTFLQKSDKFYMTYQFLSIASKTGEDIYTSNLWFATFLKFNQASLNSFTVDNIIKNSFKVEYDKSDFYTSMDFVIYKNHLYCFNRFDPDSPKEKGKPMFTIYEKDKKDSVYKFEKYSKLQGFDFQKKIKDEATKSIFAIQFFNVGPIVFLKYHPYAINIEKEKVYNLDWDPDLNSISKYSTNINYTVIQFWKKNNNFMAFVKEKDRYKLKIYDEDLKLKHQISLPFYSKNIDRIGITKSSIYLWTNDNLLKMPNFINNDKNLFRLFPQK